MPKKKVILTHGSGPPHIPNGIYIGCDQSISGTGLVAVGSDGEFIDHKLVKSSPVTRPLDKCDRIINIFQEIYNWVNALKGDRQPCIILEDFAFSQANQMALLGGLGYHIRIMLSRTNWNFATCGTGTLKKMVTGSGNSSKSAMILGAYKRWGYETDNDNLADAYGLSKISWIAYGQPFAGTMGTRKADFECVQKLEIYR